MKKIDLICLLIAVVFGIVFGYSVGNDEHVKIGLAGHVLAGLVGMAGIETILFMLVRMSKTELISLAVGVGFFVLLMCSMGSPYATIKALCDVSCGMFTRLGLDGEAAGILAMLLSVVMIGSALAAILYGSCKVGNTFKKPSINKARWFRFGRSMKGIGL